MSPSLTKKTERLHALQGIRALAAILVIFDHAIVSLMSKAGFSGLDERHAYFLGEAGVSLFFVISGFIITHSTWNMQGPADVVTFIRKRLIRIVPLYYICTLIYAAKLHGQGESVALPDLALSLGFIPYRAVEGLMRPIYGLGWTLNLELYFYVLFALSLLLPRRIGMPALIASIVAISLLGEQIDASQFISDIVMFWGSPIIYCFIIGILISVLRRQADIRSWHARLGFRPAILASFLLIYLLCLPTYPSPAVQTLVISSVAALVIGLCVFSGDAPHGKIAGLLVLLGDATYSIYLTHSFVVGPLTRLAAPLKDLHDIYWLVVLGIAVVACCVGTLCHLWLEKPLLRKISDLTLAAFQPAGPSSAASKGTGSALQRGRAL